MRVARHFDALQQAVARLVDVTFIRKSTEGLLANVFGDLAVSGKIGAEETLLPFINSPKKRFDFVMCDAIFAFPRDRWTQVDIPRAVLLEDLHGPSVAQQVRLCQEFGMEVVFHRYNLPLKKFHPDLYDGDCKCVWFPHSIDTSTFRNYGTRSLDILMVGVIVPFYYPVRARACESLKDKPYFHRVERPVETPHPVPKYPVGQDYAELLSSAKISITGGSIYHYPVMKYFEIPACKTLLMSDWFPELGMLGFEPDRNMVVADLENLPKQVEWWLSHDEERERVSERGAELIQKYHSLEIRAKQFVNHICEFLGRKGMFDIDFDFHEEFG